MILKMMDNASARPLDIVVFGATGLSGAYVVAELLERTIQSGAVCAEDADRRIGIAGRSRDKLTALQTKLGADDTSCPILVADVQDAAALAAVARQAKLIVSCAGPYRHYGEPVVAACIEAGTDYIDISGEPEYIEMIEAKYHEKAKERGVLVVSACGWDSIPAELGSLRTARRFKPPAVCTQIEEFVTIHGGAAGIAAHYATYCSAVEGIGATGELKKLRASQPKKPRPAIPGPPLKRQISPYWEKRLDAYAVPFMGADASIVRRAVQTFADHPRGLSDKGTQGIPPFHFAAYLTIPDRWSLWRYVALGTAFVQLAAREWGRRLLLEYPRFFTWGLFTKAAPTEEQTKETSFEMTFYGAGYDAPPPPGSNQPPNKCVGVRICGPDPADNSTSIIASQAALCLISARPRLAKGGVHTAGSVFGFTDLEERLGKAGVVFEDIS